MRLTIQSIILVVALLSVQAVDAASKTTWFGRNDPSYYEWSKTKLEQWLDDHKVNYAATSNEEQLRDLVQRNYDKAYDTWSESDVSSWLASRGLVPSPSVSPHKRVLNSIRRTYDDAFEYWNESDLREWLEDHNIEAEAKATRDDLLRQVRSNYNSARSYLSPPSTSQKIFNKGKETADSAIDTWTDSQLREYLLMHGVISPSGTTEELRVLAKQYGDAAKDNLQQAGQAVEEAWLKALDAPAQAYDFAAEKANAASDYIWSTWSDSDLRAYLVEKGVIKSTTQAKRDELLKYMQDNYNTAADNVYETWSESYLRKWLNKHHVPNQAAKTRDDLIDLVSKSYYTARDTTYDSWNDNQIRHWLESRGLVEPNSKKQSKELRKLIEENYYSARDQVYDTWDDNQLRHWLEKRGYIKTPAQAKRDELLQTVKDNFYTANDKVWDTWSDSQAREWLVKQGAIDDRNAAQIKRDQLEKYLSESWISAKENTIAGWKDSDIREWLINNGYLKSDAQAKRDELIKSFQDNYKVASSKTNEYVSWSDNRIRAWLRNHGIEVPMRTNRQELLQVMRENYVATQSGLGGIFHSAQDFLGGAAHVAGEALEKLKEAVSGGGFGGEEAALKAKAANANKAFQEAQKDAKKKASGLKEEL